MKYSIVIMSFAIGAFAVPQASTITSAPISVASASLTPQVSCALACPSGDVTCQAACVGIARPNSSQAVETNECAEKCDQGDGSQAATEKYSQCVQACIASFFPSSQTVALAGQSAATGAAATTGSSGAAASSGASAASGTAKATGSNAASASAASSTAKATGAANSNTVHLAGAGLAGLVLAAFAL